MNSPANSTMPLLLKNPMFIGMMFLDSKMLKMHSNKLSSCPSDSRKYSKEPENHGLAFSSMDPLEPEKHFLPKPVQHKPKAPFSPFLPLMS
jgi:hypothetical protein